ncbi:MAG: molybdopterin molybdenumtransferase MoeA, partial [Deltaproteobacteria bacterium]|nr:molybdopterin molybdenumtransferase MoeA [Deltaproteobacteria bacterium]
MKSFEDARKTILENISPLGEETVSLLDSVGRVLSEDVITAVDMPQWDNSAMDGFAVRADDCRQTATLKIMGYIPAGGVADGLLVRPGTAIKIMTGAPVPAGCTAIVPIEETTEEGDVV